MLEGGAAALVRVEALLFTKVRDAPLWDDVLAHSRGRATRLERAVHSSSSCHGQTTEALSAALRCSSSLKLGRSQCHENVPCCDSIAPEQAALPDLVQDGLVLGTQAHNGYGFDAR